MHSPLSSVPLRSECGFTPLMCGYLCGKLRLLVRVDAVIYAARCGRESDNMGLNVRVGGAETAAEWL